MTKRKTMIALAIEGVIGLSSIVCSRPAHSGVTFCDILFIIVMVTMGPTLIHAMHLLRAEDTECTEEIPTQILDIWTSRGGQKADQKVRDAVRQLTGWPEK